MDDAGGTGESVSELPRASVKFRRHVSDSTATAATKRAARRVSVSAGVLARLAVNLFLPYARDANASSAVSRRADGAAATRGSFRRGQCDGSCCVICASVYCQISEGGKRTRKERHRQPRFLLPPLADI